MKPAPGLANLCDRLVSLYRKSPQAYHAISRRVTDGLTARGKLAITDPLPLNQPTQDDGSVILKPRPRTLQGRLQAVHDCPKNDRGYVQLQATAVRSWRCEGCGTVVTLEKGGA